MTRSVTRDDARATLSAMQRYGSIPQAVWHTMDPAGHAENIFRHVPARLDGIAKLMIGLTTGSEEERASAMWFLYDALHAEARALRCAVAAVNDPDTGFIQRPRTVRKVALAGDAGKPSPHRAKRGKA